MTPVPGTDGPLTEFAESAPLRAAGWTQLKPINGRLRWRSPDGAHCWPTHRALEFLREQQESPDGAA